MQKKRSFLNAEGYRRLARNPFVDRKMLKFVQDKAHVSPQNATPLQAGSQRQVRNTGKSVISEDAAKIIAAAISSLLRE